MAYRLTRFFLFFLNAEKAHYLSVFLIHVFLKIPVLRNVLCAKEDDPRLRLTLWGLTFNNPIGLAAGFDKNASCFEDMGSLGFGFVEIGTVTPLPQDGNSKPRLFRLKKDNAIINRMGFNNDGAVKIAKRLEKRRKEDRLIIGGNIGKNKWTPIEKAEEDYLKVFAELYPYVDYFAVNVSSPNTENLRSLQDKEPLLALLRNIQQRNFSMGNPRPILLKIAPDLNNEQLDDIIAIALSLKLDGIIATNTTVSRDNLICGDKKVQAIGAGGLSGLPLKSRSTEVIRYLNQGLKGAIPIIGVGGIHSAQDALEKLEAGATLLQLYTGFIYEGPRLIKDIKSAILTDVT
ncbi:MAG: quinone-dependent dihydroorotate dehydrogenase [Bacteroidetes bacterium]|nr:quinone-dependent dihydroorotate dehydrogenase [Bacteroidota bacterium]MBM3424445.1 quinone-dependent dihydroorotate dehydrogenase [Bacteroidota bacterium]